MKLYIRLQQLLQGSGFKVANIVEEYPELTDYRVRHLMDDDAKEISREVLECVCSFLARHNIVDRSELPDALFARSPEHFWNLLFERSRITLCMGTRPDKDYHDHVVVAADSMLQASLLKRMTEAGFQTTSGDNTQPVKGRQKHSPVQVIDPRLVRTWRKKKDPVWTAKVCQEAKQCYDEFLRQPEKNTALVCFGSIKSNPVIEKVLETSFVKSVAFASEDECDDARRRTCPFLVVYRDTDPTPDSLCGGAKLFKDAKPAKPGIHYEDFDGSWRIVPWWRESIKDDQGNEIEKGEDAALVYYRFERNIPRLQIVMGGFSGAATRCLAEYLQNHQLEMDKLWPPTISNEHLDVGAFLIKFAVEGRKRDDDGLPGMYRTVREPKVIQIPIEALEHRLASVA